MGKREMGEGGRERSVCKCIKLICQTVQSLGLVAIYQRGGVGQALRIT